MTSHDRIDAWLQDPSIEEETKQEIRKLQKTDPKALFDAFSCDLSFGTGGMRGLLGVGTNRMNRYTIRKATQGLANFLKKSGNENLSVLIGYDVRHGSSLFAQEAASVLVGNGCKVFLTKDVCATPLVSFGCRYFGCDAAIMITASHNPPTYNGFKVYGSDGAQVIAPQDSAIVEEVERVREIRISSPTPPHVHLVGEELLRAYIEELQKVRLSPTAPMHTLKVLYTPLHGTGLLSLPPTIASWGVHHLSLVQEQSTLDPNFSHAPSPNPEEKGALLLGTEQLARERGDILLATDPDADRLGVVLSGGHALTGNQIGVLLLYHILSTLQRQKRLPPNGAVVKTLVTTQMFAKIAADFSIPCIDVLTGFKYIAEKIHTWEIAHDGYQYLFGAEESYGYLYPTFVRDKDALSSSCLLLELAALEKALGRTLLDTLHLLYEKYGTYQQRQKTISFPPTQEGKRAMQQYMQERRENSPTHIGNIPVRSVEDFLQGSSSLPPSDTLRYHLEDESTLVFRPSGTEPKIKIYAEVQSETLAQGEEKLSRLLQT